MRSSYLKAGPDLRGLRCPDGVQRSKAISFSEGENAAFMIGTPEG